MCGYLQKGEGYYAYMIRNKLLEETRADYVLLGKSKGLSKKEKLPENYAKSAKKQCVESRRDSTTDNAQDWQQTSPVHFF